MIAKFECADFKVEGDFDVVKRIINQLIPSITSDCDKHELKRGAEMLTNEKIEQIAMKSGNAVQATMYGWPAQNLEFARAIESAVREECAAPVAEVSASGHDLNYADYAHALDVIYAFAPPEPLDKLPGGNAYQEGWIDGTQAYQLTIEQQGEQK